MHKSQGMSLRFVEVNCKKATFPGQVGVAVGRAQTSKGLRVINYRPALCKEHPKYVRDFYEKDNSDDVYSVDLSCCRNHECFEDKTVHTITDNLDSDSEIDDLIENVEQIENLDHSYYSINTVDSSEMDTRFQSAFNDFKHTPVEAKARIALDTILSKGHNLSLWYSKQCSTIETMYDNCCTVQAGNLKQKHLTEFHTLFQQYMTSDEYTQSIKSVTEVEFSSYLFSSVMFLIQENFLKNKAATVEIPEEKVSLPLFPSPESTLTAPGKGKIRYVGGYCVAKVRYRLCKTMRNCFFVPGMTPEINKIQEQINIMDDMTISASDILTTTVYEETLEETSWKQNTAEGLTNISDNVF